MVEQVFLHSFITAWKLLLDSVMLNNYCFCYLSESVFSLGVSIHVYLAHFFRPSVRDARGRLAENENTGSER